MQEASRFWMATNGRPTDRRGFSNRTRCPISAPMATDSAALKQRPRLASMRRRSPEATAVRSPARPLMTGIGLDQPFFDDKDRAFWILQTAGWTGYFILRTLSGFANSMGAMYVVHTAILTATGYSLTLLMATLFRWLISL